jgi:hypothetical protein
MKNRKLLEYIAKKIVEDMPTLMEPKNNKLNMNLEWYREEKIIYTRQLLTSTFESEAISLTKIDHPMYFRRRFLKSKLIWDEVNELRANESSLKNQDYIQKLFTDWVDPNGRLKTDKIVATLMSQPDNPFQYKFSNDPLDGPALWMYAKRKIVFTIRLDKTLKVPKTIWVSAYTESTKSGGPLPPESKSKYKFFQSINSYAIHALNTYVSYEDIPILALIEWWRNFAQFSERKWKITNNRLYWSQEFQFLPTDFCSVELKETDLIHKSSNIFK